MANSLGLFSHPFQTWRKLFREQDLSQIVLLLAFPAYLFFGGLFVIWFLRRLLKDEFNVIYGVWGMPTKLGVTLVFMLTLALFFYLAFWLYKVLKVKK